MTLTSLGSREYVWPPISRQSSRVSFPSISASLVKTLMPHGALWTRGAQHPAIVPERRAAASGTIDDTLSRDSAMSRANLIHDELWPVRRLPSSLARQDRP